MLRLAVLILILANAGYYAWSNGKLRELGWGPSVQAEPQRLEQQIDPQKLVATPMASAASASASASSTTPAPAASAASAPAAAASPASEAAPQSAASAPTATAATAPVPTPASVRTVCLQAGSFDEAQAQAWRSAAQGALPDSSWKFDSATVSGRWMVYMGKFPDDETLVKKRGELRALQIDYDRPGPAFEPGLSLGRFSTEEAAQRALTQLSGKGVRTARVVVERKESTAYTLKLPAVDDATRTKINGMKNALSGKSLQSCSS